MKSDAKNIYADADSGGGGGSIVKPPDALFRVVYVTRSEAWQKEIGDHDSQQSTQALEILHFFLNDDRTLEDT